jgi:uncharacterized protein
MNLPSLTCSWILRAGSLAVLCWPIGAGVVSAQAVDCATPANAAQKTICGDPNLKALDAKMATLYIDANKGASSAGKNEIAAEQRRWIVSRDNCSKDKDVTGCIIAAYTARNQLLSAYVSKAAKPADAEPVMFSCDDTSTLTITFINGAKPQARVRQGEQFWTLPQVKSASGARFAKGNVSVWNKGKEVTFQQGTKKTTCTQR